MKIIKFARGLNLPIDAITQTFGIIARKGAGKTYAAMKMAEEMLQAKAQIIALDPVGVWNGLRLGANGKSKGFPIPVLGGDQGDIPLEHTAGKLVANMVMDTGTSVVLDISLFRKAQRKEFVADFAEQLFHRAKKKREPLHVFFEEAQTLAPQRPGPGEQRMLGAIEDIVRLGRNYGIGASLISQRPQSINKEVLNQVEALLVMQVNAAHERKAINEWIVHQGIDVTEMVKELPSLPIGTGYFWSPQWLGILKKIHINKKKTYDSSSTPKVGKVKIKPKKLMKVNLGALQEAMAATIEKIKANDPKELKKQLVMALRQVTELEYRIDNQKPVTKEIEVSVFKKGDLKNLKKDVKQIDKALEKIKSIHDAWGHNLNLVRETLDNLTNAIKNNENRVHHTNTMIKKLITPNKNKPEKKSQFSNDVNISAIQQKILITLVNLAAVNINEPKKLAVAAISGYKVKGHFNNTIGSLKTNGYIDYPGNGAIAITIAGERLVPTDSINQLITLNDLHDKWEKLLSKIQWKILKELILIYPNNIDKNELANISGYNVKGHFTNTLGSLKTMGIINYPERGCVVATDMLFPEGLR